MQNANVRGNEQFYWLAVVAIINTVISLYYYARIFKAMYLETPAQPVTSKLSVSWAATILLAVFALPTFIFGIAFAPLLDLATASVKFFSGVL